MQHLESAEQPKSGDFVVLRNPATGELFEVSNKLIQVLANPPRSDPQAMRHRTLNVISGSR